MKRNKWKRLIAALLTITITLQALPMQVFAQQPEEPVNSVPSPRNRTAYHWGSGGKAHEGYEIL